MPTSTQRVQNPIGVHGMRLLRIVLLGSIALLSTDAASANDCCCRVQCPCCKHICKLSIEESADTKHCWQIECKPICIPHVTFPWQSCCSPKCATLKYVRTLKRVEYECPACKYEWTAEPRPCCGPCECDGISAGPPGGAGDPPPPPAALEAARPSLIAPFAKLFSR